MTEIVVWSLVFASTLGTGGVVCWLVLRFAFLDRSRLLARASGPSRVIVHALGILACTLLVASPC